MAKVTISLIEKIAHEFNLDIPSDADIDITDAHEVMQWATDNDLIDYTDGEPIGENELSIS